MSFVRQPDTPSRPPTSGRCWPRSSAAILANRLVIFLDSNVPMYLVGAPHPRKSDTQRMLERFIGDRQRLVTDAEVLQEVLHRYVAIDRRDAIQPAFDALLGLVDEVFPVDRAAVEQARVIIMGHRRLSARAAIHPSVVEPHGGTRTTSFAACRARGRGMERIAWGRAPAHAVGAGGS